MNDKQDSGKANATTGSGCPPPPFQTETDLKTPHTADTKRQVSRFSRFIITWVIFIPLTLPFMGGELGQAAFPQAIGAALAVAAIAWLFTVGMKPTRAALASTLCIAFALYLMSMAGRFLGRDSGRSESHHSDSTQTAVPPSVRDSLEKTARQINSQAPMRVDKHTVLNSASFSGRAAIYRNTLDLELSDEKFRELLRDLRPLTVGNFKRNPSDAKAFAKYRIVVVYQYTEKGGKVMNPELLT